jgi:hypothetical protein
MDCSFLREIFGEWLDKGVPTDIEGYGGIAVVARLPRGRTTGYV